MKDNFVIITALATSEEQATSRLSDLASKGLALVDFKVPMISYRFAKSESQTVDYLIDFSKNANAEYFEMYAEHGWMHIFSHEQLHYFKAEKGVARFNTDIEGKAQRYLMESKRYGKASIICLLPVILFGFLLFNFQSVGEWITLPLFVLTSLSVMTLIFFMMPAITYYLRAKRL